MSNCSNNDELEKKGSTKFHAAYLKCSFSYLTFPLYSISYSLLFPFTKQHHGFFLLFFCFFF